MHSARTAKLAIIASSLVIATQAPATQTLYGTHYDETISHSCFATTYCQVLFSQLPSDKLTLVHRATCRFTTTVPVYVSNLQVSATTNGATLGRYVQLTLNTPGPVGGSYFTTVDVDPEFLMGPSRYPYVEAYTSTNSTIFIECTLSGELVTPIQ
ncbi:hypothetical protein JQ612_14445 [Bradyrhizobium manausense]|uniref:hypothetical protein n=1 Tax=Bradyrhizobium manausense TaxID=989370 RepID=UPI001BAC6265|nr:hypothetical protein [Bradyrhizobium manausense]MBR0834388.1 hypothetical protein [Bradyrhizobium manausense]